MLYGDMPAAEKMISGIANPEQRATAQLTVADVLWRMGQSATAEAYIERAKKTAALVQDQARRARLISSAIQAAQYMSDPPPNTFSPLPQPPADRNPPQSVFPSFPITADGLGDKTAGQREQQAESNQALLETLYARISTGDVEGLRHLLDTVSDPFQKTLVLASIEHLLI